MSSLLAAGAGCAMIMNGIEKPSAKVRTVSLASAGFSGVTGAVRLDVTNPNSVGVPLTGLDWSLSLGGARAITGAVQLQQEIPAHGVAPVETSLSIAAGDAIAAASALASGTRDYHITVHLHFSTKVGPLDVPIETDGTLGADLAMR